MTEAKRLKEEARLMRLAKGEARERLQHQSNIPPEDLGKLWKLAEDSFDTEEQSIDLIKRHLLTQEQRQIMFDNDFTIADMLNGRIPGDHTIYYNIFAEWNAKLGYKAFGF